MAKQHPSDKMISYHPRGKDGLAYMPMSRIIRVTPLDGGSEIYYDTGALPSTLYASDAPELIALQMDNAFGWLSKEQANEILGASLAGLRRTVAEAQS